jgi:hypothetical protein
MTRRSRFLAVAVAAIVAIAAPAFAQQGTIITTGGERISGHIRDMDQNGYTVLVNGSERRVMVPEIAAVEFSSARNPNNDEQNRLNEGRQLVILKDGTALVGTISGYERTQGGRLADLPMSHAFRINFNGQSGDRSFLSSEVAKIYFKPTSSTSGTAGQTPTTGTTEGREIIVRADRGWTATGITVRRGDTIRFEASGEIQLSPDPNDKAGIAGSLSGRNAPNAPLRNSLAGALIGRIGNGAPFGIGDQATVQAPASGRLFLGVNDDGLSDNSGEFRVVVVAPNAGGIRR